jgi:transposase InsO family protein
MSGDGVSLPTTLAQTGSVAKTQARGQQSSPQVTPFSEQTDDQEKIRIQRVKETSETEKNRVVRQEEEKDKRKRRRLKRNRKKAYDEMRGKHENTDSEDGERDRPEIDEEILGSLIDLRV